MEIQRAILNLRWEGGKVLEVGTIRRDRDDMGRSDHIRRWIGPFWSHSKIRIFHRIYNTMHNEIFADIFAMIQAASFSVFSMFVRPATLV